MPEYKAYVTPVELLASIPAKTNGQPVVVLVFRVRPNHNFVPTQVSLSKLQAKRLRDDLTSLLGKEQPIWTD